MATSLGTVQAVAGKFYAQDDNGNVRVLKVGDTISQGEKVFGDTNNAANSALEILSNNQELLSLTGTNSLVFDMSTNEATFGNEEVAFSPNSAWMPTQNAEIPTEGQEVAQTEAGDITEEETAAGNEAVSSSDIGVFSFDNRDGDAVNIKADLRNTSFPEDEVDPTDNGDDRILNEEYNVTLGLTGLDANEDEAGATFTLTLSNPTTESATLVIDANGTTYTYTIPTGSTSYSFDIPTQDSDVYVDPDTLTVSVVSLTGGGYDNVDVTGATSTINISDTVDTTTAILTSSGDGDEDSGSITYTVNVDYPPQNDQEFIIELSNGQTQTIIVPAGELNGSITFAWGDLETNTSIGLNGYPDSDSTKEEGFTLNIINFSAVGNSGNYENLVTVNESTDVTIEDTIDTTTVTVGDASVNEDATSASVDVTLEGHVFKAGETVTVTLSDGTEVAFTENGTQTATFTFDSDSDSIKEDDATSAINATVASSAGEIENPVVNAGELTVTDKEDTTTVTLSATESTSEDDGIITYTASLSTGVTANNDITVMISVGANGEPASETNPALTITIPAGQTSGTVDAIVNRDNDDGSGEDKYKEIDSLSAAITNAVETNAGEVGSLENLTFDSTPVTTTILDDSDVTTVSITGTITTPSTIDVTNVTGHPNGINVYAIGNDGQETNLSVITRTDHDGFGVETKINGVSREDSNGDTKELGMNEKIVVEFENEVKSIDVAFAWRNNHEKAVVTFFDENGEKVGSAMVSGGGSNTEALITYYDENGNITKTETAQGGSDKVDLEYKFEPGNGQTFSKIEFSAPGEYDDYLINKITYKEVVDSDITDVTITEGEVTLEIQTSNPPQEGYPAIAIVQVGDTEYQVQLDINGRGTLNVSINGDEELVATVKEIRGGNFEAVDVSGANWKLASDPTASDDNISVLEDQTYYLETDDFGNTQLNVKQVEITEVPQNGTLYIYNGNIVETIITNDGKTVNVYENKVAVSTGTVISMIDIAAGKVIFVPNENSDEEGSFKFKVGDSNGNFMETEYTTTIEVKAVADMPTASIDVTKIVSSTSSEELIVKVGDKTYNISEILVNKDSYTEVSNIQNNTEVYAENIIVNENMDSNDFLKTSNENNIIVLNGDLGNNAKIESMNGDDFIAILGDLHNGTLNDSDGIDTLYLNKASSYYSWNVNQHNGNTGMDGTITQYADEGHTQVVGTLYVNNIEGIIFADGVTVGSVEKIETITSTAEYEVDISAALNDLDGSETLTVQISGVPAGASFDLDTLVDKGNGVWELTITEGTKSVNYENIKMTVPVGSENVDLTITATATEARDNENGQNYAQSSDSDAVVYSSDISQIVSYDAVNTNLILTIDVSGSMKEELVLAKEALINMINQYDDLGDVKIMLTTLSDYGETLKSSSGSVWFSASEAIAKINALSANGGTNYDDALLDVIDALDKEPAPLDGQTISYFVSDGEPTYGMYEKTEWSRSQQKYITKWVQDGNGYSITDINDDIVEEWLALNIDKTYTIGIGTDALNDYLREISQTPDEDVIIINNANDLNVTLQGTMNSLVEGNVLDNISGGDGNIIIDSIEINDTEYTKDTFPTDGIALDGDGKLVFDFETGDYHYSVKSSDVDGDIIKTFKVNASDEDGDNTSLDVTINVLKEHESIVGNESDNIISFNPNTTIIDGGAGEDTLKLLSGQDIDFASLGTTIKQIEEIDLSVEGENEITNLSARDVFDMTDENNEIKISGTSEDKVNLSNEWSSKGTESGFDIYEATINVDGQDQTIKLEIKTEIQDI